MVVKKLLFIVLFLFAFECHAQRSAIDSIQSLIQQSKSINAKAEQYHELGKLYLYSENDSAFKYFTKAISLAENRGKSLFLAEAYNELGILWYKRSNTDSSFYYLDKAYEIAAQRKDAHNIVRSRGTKGLYQYYSRKYDESLENFREALTFSEEIDDKLLSKLHNNVAMVFKATSKVDLALEYYHKALALCEAHGDSAGIGIVCSNIGLLYQNQGNTPLALDYLYRSLEIRLDQGNRKGESYVLTNLGVVYEGLKEYDKALDCYKKSLEIKKEVGSGKGIAILYGNIGIIFREKAILDSAIYYSNESLKLRLEMGDKLGEARARTNLGQTYRLQSRYADAERELKKALELASGFKNYNVLQTINKALYQLYYEQDSFEEAIPHMVEMYAYKDSVFNINKERSLANIEANYNNLKREKEYEILQQSNQLKEAEVKRQTFISLGLFVVVVLFIVLLILVYRSRNNLSEKNKKIEQQAFQLKQAYRNLKQLSDFKEATTNMLIHDLKNPLNIIVNAKSLKELESFDDLIQQSGYTMQNLVYNVLDVYKYQDTKLKLNKGSVRLQHVVEKAIEEVHYLQQTKNVRISFDGSLDRVIEVDKEILKRVFVNLLSNAIKYTPENGVISVNAKTVSKRNTRIGVANPGPGIPRDKRELIFGYFEQGENGKNESIPSSGLGLAFCKLAVEAHDGEIGVISPQSDGVEFWLTIPEN